MYSEPVIGLIPAAGKGTRLNLPYPKELYPIIRDNRYKPLTQFVVENLIASDVKDIVFVINETKHQLIGYFGSGRRFNCQFSYVVQESLTDANGSTSPGLAHALDSAYHLVCGKTVLFGMADTIMEPIDVFRCLLQAAAPEDQVILGLFTVTRPHKFGMVDFDESGRVRQIIDKPAQTDLKYAWGCIAWRPAFTEFLHHSVNSEGIADFARIMNNAISQGMPFRSVVVPGGSYADLGTYEEIVELEGRYRG
ncbi:MAG: NTP transferase domain-containing protein [Chloroflexi bacterium]|jgi:glucose-1-phosphate thymidylyltransferase|nr:NTP transferase domain-containing protein [Chloroflexota bacterium]